MTTDPFTDAARAEANSRTEQWGDERNRRRFLSMFTSGAEWARDHLTTQEPTAAGIESLVGDITRWDDTTATDGPCDATWDSLAQYLTERGWTRQPSARAASERAWGEGVAAWRDYVNGLDPRLGHPRRDTPINPYSDTHDPGTKEPMPTPHADPRRTHLPETGLYVHALDTDGAQGPVDIAHLHRDSLDTLYASLRDQLLHNTPSDHGQYTEHLRVMGATQAARRALHSLNTQEGPTP